jgi:hypothetical protein
MRTYATEEADLTDETSLNTYHNASTPPAPDVPAERAAFMLAADPILAQAPDAELRAHPEWCNFSGQADEHPPTRGWLVTPLIGSDGLNYGFIQVTDRLEGDFTE